MICTYMHFSNIRYGVLPMIIRIIDALIWISRGLFDSNASLGSLISFLINCDISLEYHLLHHHPQCVSDQYTKSDALSAPPSNAITVRWWLWNFWRQRGACGEPAEKVSHHTTCASACLPAFCCWTSVKFVTCICPNCEMDLLEMWNVFAIFLQTKY